MDILLIEFRNFTFSSTSSSVLLDPHSFPKLFKMGKDGISIQKATCGACSQSTTHGTLPLPILLFFSYPAKEIKEDIFLVIIFKRLCQYAWSGDCHLQLL